MTANVFCPFAECRKPLEFDIGDTPTDEEFFDEDCPGCDRRLRITILVYPGTKNVLADCSPTPA